MPHPREAIHDVLKAKQEKLREQRRRGTTFISLQQAFERWTNDNKRSKNPRG